MKVHVILHLWDEPEESGADVLGVYTDYNVAVSKMREAAAEKSANEVDRYEKTFDDDFCQDDDTRIRRGWYGSGYERDCTWTWEVRTMEVE